MNKSYKRPFRLSSRLKPKAYAKLKYYLKVNGGTKSSVVEYAIERLPIHPNADENKADKLKARRATYLYDKSSHVTTKINGIGLQIKRIGINLNQIAKRTNQGKALHNGNLAKLLVLTIKVIPRMLYELAKIAQNFNKAVSKIQERSDNP